MAVVEAQAPMLSTRPIAMLARASRVVIAIRILLVKAFPSQFQTIQPNPEIRLGPAVLLHVEALGAAGARDRRRPPQRGAHDQLLAEFIRRPDLSGLDVRLHARHAEDGVAAREHGLKILLVLARQHLAVMERDPETRLARRLIDLV